MPVLMILLTLVVIGALVWVIHRFGAPYIAAPFLTIIDVVAVALTLWWLLKITGVWAYLLELRL